MHHQMVPSRGVCDCELHHQMVSLGCLYGPLCT